MKYIHIPEVQFFFDPETQRFFATFPLVKKRKHVTIIFQKSMYVETDSVQLTKEKAELDAL